MPPVHFTDDSWNFWVLYDRLENHFKKFKTLIIAYDVDDTVRAHYSHNCEKTIELIKRCEEVIHPIFIAYTANPHIDEVEKYLKENEIPFDAINDYPQGMVSGLLLREKMENPSLKLYYNIFLEDKSFGLRDSCRALNILCNKVESAYGKGGDFDLSKISHKTKETI